MFFFLNFHKEEMCIFNGVWYFFSNAVYLNILEKFITIQLLSTYTGFFFAWINQNVDCITSFQPLGKHAAESIEWHFSENFYQNWTKRITYM